MIALLTGVGVFMMGLTGCSVSDAQQRDVRRLIEAKMPEFERSMQAAIMANKDFADIRGGEWKWTYESGGGDTVKVKYGYYGQNPRWKIIVGGLIGVLLLVCTLGYVYWSPWSLDAALYATLDVDLKAQSVTRVKD